MGRRGSVETNNSVQCGTLIILEHTLSETFSDLECQISWENHSDILVVLKNISCSLEILIINLLCSVIVTCRNVKMAIPNRHDSF